jgi:TolA-binding protein
MSSDRPPFEPSEHRSAEHSGARSTEMAASNDTSDVSAERVMGAVRGEKEFEFSHLVLGEPIPFAVPAQRVEHTWARLSKASAGAAVVSPGAAHKRLTGPLIAFAACAATFAAGVWVGEGNGGRGGFNASSRVMSAEPLSVALPSGNIPADMQRAQQPAKMAEQAASATSMASEPPASNAGEAESRVVGRARLGHGVLPSVNPVAGSTTAGGVLPAPVHTSEVAVAMTATAVGAPAWQRLANDGDYEGALAEITAAGGFERTVQLASAEQLMLLSDVARGTGQQQRALAALRRIVSEHAADQVAPLAALNMGNLLDKMGDSAGATQAFAVYRALSPNGDFAEDSLVRQIRSAVGAGQQDLARRLVRQYEVDFPEGRQADEVARWAERIPTESESGDAGTAQSEAAQ